MMHYIYTSRFQPFNIKELAELKWLMEESRSNQAKIVMGIINPDPTRHQGKSDPSGFWQRHNPLSYWQRYQTIVTIINHIGCSDEVVGIVPVPGRPSQKHNMQLCENVFPPRAARKMCVPCVFMHEEENKRIKGLEKQGEEVLPIPTHAFAPRERIVFQELVTCLMASEDSRLHDKWKCFVPEAIFGILEHARVINTVKRHFLFDKRDPYHEIKEKWSPTEILRDTALHEEVRRLFAGHFIEESQYHESGGTAATLGISL